MDPNVIKTDGFYCINESLSAVYHTYKLNLRWIEITYMQINVFTGTDKKYD
jgi:microsomal dipeptidase-like Zn-dependent dipeptidase